MSFLKLVVVVFVSPVTSELIILYQLSEQCCVDVASLVAEKCRYVRGYKGNLLPP